MKGKVPASGVALEITFSSKIIKATLRFGSYYEYIKKNKTLLDPHTLFS